MARFYLLFLVFFIILTANAQTSCRPGIAMIDYSGHNDHFPNPDMDSIIAIRPDILIDNTPGGFWHGQCLPPIYSPYGIKVYSYVHGSYESYDSATLISQIDAIDLDGAYGVFLDEVSTSLDAHKKSYLLTMINEAHAKGLKIILNPGTNTFDTFLYRADYIMTDEHFTTRSMSASELVNPSKIIVVNEGVTTAAAAAAVTDSARSKNFAYSYACTDYMVIPSWIRAYMTLVTYPTPTPTVTMTGATLYSNIIYGNQWYSVTTGLIPGATGGSFTPSASGSYYDIVTQSGCASAPSDTLTISPTGMITAIKGCDFRIYPNPASEFLHIDNAESADFVICDLIGRVVVGRRIDGKQEVISLSELSPGIYMIEIVANGYRTVAKFVKQ